VGCEGCHISVRGQVEALNAARQQAANYAEQTKKTVVLWSEGFEYFFGPYESNTDKPFTEVFSVDSGITA